MLHRVLLRNAISCFTALATLGTALGCASAPPPTAEPPRADGPAAPTSASVAPAPSSAPAPAAPQVVQTVVTRLDAKPDANTLSGLPELPRPSPNAEVKQDVGITEVSVSYSSPGVKGRTIWGQLVPYGQLWRTGANAPTKLSVDRDFSFGGVQVAAGSYSLITIPKQGAWTVILNQDPTNQGAFARDAKLDVAVVEVTPTQAPMRERLAFLFANTTEASTELVMDWAGVSLAIPIAVDTNKHVADSVTATIDNAWRPLFNAGRYAFGTGDYARAQDLLARSIAVRETWWNHWWMAQVLAKQNQHQQARQHAQQAMTLGEKDDIFKRAFAEEVKKALASWPQG